MDTFAMYVQAEELFDEDVYEAMIEYMAGDLDDGGADMT